MRNRLNILTLTLAVALLAALTACRGTPSPTAICQTPSASPVPSAAPPPTTQPVAPAGTIQGLVVDDDGPVAGAIVRVRATENKTTTGADGTFTLSQLEYTTPISVTAWAEGYFVGWVSLAPGTQPVTITIKPYYTTDNPDYSWFSMEGAEGSKSCGHCMPAYAEWQNDVHSQSAVNPRFLTTYNGTDVDGNQSPPTRYGYSRDYGRFPLLPDPTQPYFGPGYKLDFPDTAGNCAACHVPVAAAQPGRAYGADPNRLSLVESEGVSCEFCHKMGEVTLDPDTGLPYPNMPGVLSLRLYRPDEGQQLFFGNFDDVTRRVSYLPLEEESAFCAPCHFGVFWDTVIYNSFGEWLESPYSDPDTGQTCQNCHMPIAGYDYFTFPDKGGLTRDPNRIFSHLMPGATDETLLQNAVTMAATARLEAGALIVQVDLTNDKTGHHVPTDSPLRHLILLVQASDGQGQTLAQLDGPTVPEWGGIGDPQQGYYAGLPGKAYAKVLQEMWTEITPSGAYWNPTRVLSDNRLAAFATDTSLYTFAAPEGGPITVDVTLIFRRAFIDLVDQKKWEVPDIEMEKEQVVVER